MDPRFRCFAEETAEKRLDLKSLKGRTKAEELGDQVPELLSLRLSLKALLIEPFLSRFSGKIRFSYFPKIPFKFKKSYRGTPEPLTAQDAPWLNGPSLKIDLYACF